VFDVLDSAADLLATGKSSRRSRRTAVNLRDIDQVMDAPAVARDRAGATLNRIDGVTDRLDG
jgi:hypothetical protein